MREVNKKVLGIAIAFLFVAMLATPIIGTVMAIGPENAIGKNPHLSPPMPYGFTMMLDAQKKPHGVVVSWELGSIYRLELDASVFEIKSAFVVTDVTQVEEMENKWLYLSHDMQLDWMLYVGTPPGFAEWIASFHPIGVYMKWNIVGQ